MNLLILAAAGSGTRFGSEIPKQFQPYQGRRLYLHSLSTIAPVCDRGVVVVPSEWVSRVESKLSTFPWGDRYRVVKGGAERQDSVLNGLLALDHTDGVVLVHDAARPFVSRELALQVLNEAREHGACVPGVPLPDTIKEVHGVYVKRTLDRAALRAIQTPQGFQLGLLKRAFEEAIKGNFRGTDEAVLVERTGAAVRVVPGEPGNLKVTWPEDLH